MLLVQIVAGENNFAALSRFSSSGQVVLLGSWTNDFMRIPKILCGLQNRSIISISHGDHHSVALTSDGKLLTWGKDRHGSLGLGVESDFLLKEPREVVFPTGKYTKCIRATASGWHTGALVVDLQVRQRSQFMRWQALISGLCVHLRTP